jgi:hypothetical protein
MYPHSSRLGPSPASDQEIATCYRRASWAREHAKQVNDPVPRQCLIAMERRWLSRVHGDEFFGRPAPKARADAALARPVDWRSARPIQNISGRSQGLGGPVGGQFRSPTAYAEGETPCCIPVRQASSPCQCRALGSAKPSLLTRMRLSGRIVGSGP